MARPDPPSEEQLKEIAAMLSAAMKPPRPPPSLNERLSVAEILRRWIYVIGAAIVAATIVVLTIRANSTFVREWGPKVKVMWWMKENGYTNKDVQPIGPIKPPDFEE